MRSEEKIQAIILLVAAILGVAIASYQFGKSNGYDVGYTSGYSAGRKNIVDKHEKSINEAITQAYISGCRYEASAITESLNLNLTTATLDQLIDEDCSPTYGNDTPMPYYNLR